MNKKEENTKLYILRDIFRLIREFENSFKEKYNLCLNEGMAIDSLKQRQMTSSDLADRLGLSASNMSKVIKSIEEKELVERILGKEDKRQMYFTLTKKGKKKLEAIKEEQNIMHDVLNSIYLTRSLD